MKVSDWQGACSYCSQVIASQMVWEILRASSCAAVWLSTSAKPHQLCGSLRACLKVVMLYCCFDPWPVHGLNNEWIFEQQFNFCRGQRQSLFGFTEAVVQKPQSESLMPPEAYAEGAFRLRRYLDPRVTTLVIEWASWFVRLQIRWHYGTCSCMVPVGL